MTHAYIFQNPPVRHPHRIPMRQNSDISASRLSTTDDPLFENLRLHQPIPIMHHQGILPGRNDSLMSPLHQLVLIRPHGVFERLSGGEMGLEGAAEGAGVVDGVVETLAAILYRRELD